MICKVLLKESRAVLFADLVLAIYAVAEQEAGLVINDEFRDGVATCVADAVQPIWELIKKEHAAQEAARVRTGHGGTWPKVQP